MTTCAGCRSTFGWILQRRGTCPGCRRDFCGACLVHSCVTQGDADDKGVAAPIATFCGECFRRESALDFATDHVVYGPAKGAAHCVLLLHSAGGCRTMCAGLARQLAVDGFRCVCVDLPGHGARMDEPCTMEAATECIAQCLAMHTALFNGRQPTLLGASLGGYLAMEFVGRYPDRVSRAIVALCGQDVGVHRGVAASVGLCAMDVAVPLLSSATMLSGLVGQCKHMAPDVLVDDFLRPGMFFNRCREHVAVLRATDPAASLAAFPGRVLFVNGSGDHRDSEDVWLRQAGAGSRLVVYDGADHFLAHDQRYAARFHGDCLAFLADD